MSTGNHELGPAPGAAPKKGRRFGLDKRFLAPILITVILTVGDYQYRFLPNYLYTVLAILSAIALEVVLGRWVTGKWPHLASAYITGISVGILVQALSFWPFVLCSLLSISSKYALRVKDRHLWNPSNLGVSLLLLFAPQVVAPLSQQWGSELWPLLVIWCLGSVILYTLGRLHITLTYVAAFTALAWVRSLIEGGAWITEVAPLTQPGYQLFIFFMITDPKTTTRTWRRQCAVAVLVAVVETALRLVGGKVGIHAPYYALFIVAPVSNLLEIWWEACRAPKAIPVRVEAAPMVASDRSEASSPNPAPVVGPSA